LEDQRDRQEAYYDEKSKYRTFAPGQQVIIYYPNPPPGVSPKFHIFWKTFTVIEMVGRVNVKASQHNKKAIVVHIDRVLDFDATGSKKEQTENIHCIGIDLEAEREWARIDREKTLGQQEAEEEEENEVQWHIRRRTAGASLLHPSTSATRQPVMAPKTTPPPPPTTALAESDRELLSTPPPSSSSGKRQPPLLPPIAKKKRGRAGAEGKQSSCRSRHRQSDREKEERPIAKESGESSQSRAAGRTAGHRLAGQLHPNGSSHLWSKQRTTGAGENPRRSRRGCRQWRRGDAEVVADGADFKQEAGADGADFKQDANT
jgi:hypothetical protein